MFALGKGYFFKKKYFLFLICIVFLYVKNVVAGSLITPQWEIKLGVISGAHEKIAKIVSDVAMREGLSIKIITFSDFFQPNSALNEGSLDANSFQHQPYLDLQIKSLDYHLVSVAKTFHFPMGIYSKKINSLDNLPKGAKIAIPNDPSNAGRALSLLEKNGLVKLSNFKKINASPLDIIDNPKGYRFMELDAAQLPRSLSDVDLAVINADFAFLSGLNPLNDALDYEKINSPYVNVITVRNEDQDKPWVKILIKSYESNEVKEFVKKEFKGSVLYCS